MLLPPTYTSCSCFTPTALNSSIKTRRSTQSLPLFGRGRLYVVSGIANGHGDSLRQFGDGSGDYLNSAIATPMTRFSAARSIG